MHTRGIGPEGGRGNSSFPVEEGSDPPAGGECRKTVGFRDVHYLPHPPYAVQKLL